MNDYIRIKGARANNLKNVDIEIPRNKLVVMTGVSGSGKSSLAFDTIYAEGQRRYVESLSSYARQFLGQMDKPDLDYIQGLSPAISIDQKTGSRNPRSTVGTVTEIYDYMRLLWARIGKPHCPKCGKEIRQQTIDQIIDQLMLLPEGTKLMILAPVVRARKGEYVKVFEDARRSGYVRVRVDGSMYELSEEIKLDKNKKHTIEVVVDRVVIKDGIMRRLADSVETAASLANGLVIADVVSENRQILFSQNYACPDCGISIEELTPRMFSFNTPYGACPKCDGLGMQLLVDPDLIIPDDSLSINGGAIKATGWGSGADSIAAMYYNALAEKYGFTLDTPIAEMPDGVKDILLYGSKGEKLDLSYERERKNSSFAGKFSRPFEGICKNLERRYFETQSPAMRAEIEECMSEVTCPECHGQRLRKEALAVTVGGINIARMGDMSVTEAIEFVESLELSEKEHIIADRIIKEIKARLGFLKNVGLQYLSLSRGAATLSGGESQRIRLATQIGAALTGVLYILDEPSIGLHQRDNEKLLKTLEDLRDLGNTLIVVEHDEDTMRAADYIVDIGPGAGVHGGNVVAAGTVEDICACPDSLTGQYLSGKRKIPVPAERRKTDKGFIHISGAAEHNLKNVDIDIPKGVITCVTGVSGSGKSTAASLICRFWDITEGQICMGGVPLNQIPLSDLMSQISFVTQNTFLFKKSIRDNIMMGNPEATEEEMMQAAKDAVCHDFIMRLPKGYDTVIDKETKLSGGEKQRITLARAILKNAPVVILDEATAYIDADNEDLLQKALAKLSEGKTVLVIAHRLSSIKEADSIVVLEQGKVIDCGTHDELINRCSPYQDMWAAFEQSDQWKMGGVNA